MQAFIYLVFVVLIVALAYFMGIIKKIRQLQGRQEWTDSQEYTTLRIDVPKHNDKKPLAAEQMFASIHGIFSHSALFQNHLSFEIVARDKYIQFYVYVPKHIKDFVEGQIYAQYPTVEIHEVEDYTRSIELKNGVNFASCDLIMTKPDVYPIKAFTDFEVDPLSGITSVMTKLNQGEEVWFQLVIRPIGDEWQYKGNNIVSLVRAGRKPHWGTSGAFLRGAQSFMGAMVQQVVYPGAEPKDQSEIKLPATVENALKGIEEKIMKLGFETKIRILSISDDSASAKVRCQSVAAAFKQYNTTNLNGFRATDINLNDTEEWKDYIERSFDRSGNILNITELASIYHLPHETVTTPNIVWSGSKKSEPPAKLPLMQNSPDDSLTILGLTNFRNTFHEFGIKGDDRRRHIYIVGKSGTGKSTLIENMAVDDVVRGKGVIVVDPHGELADKVLSCVPDDRINDVIVFDPADRSYPIGFNLLEHVEDDFKGMVASGFVGIFKKIFGDSWGPRLEHILRNTVLALLDYPDSTMLDIPRMLTDNRFRDKAVEKVKDPVIREFWINEFAQYDSKFRNEAVSPILNKVGQFLATATIRNIVGQPKSRINIREIMDQKKILVVNLSRGKIGEDNSALLGAMMITKIQLAAMSRADVTADNRPDTYLYVDEFQNFATESFAVILSEARKYNLCLTMANQYIEQMTEEVRSAVFGNAGTIITFRVGGTDADFLVKEFEPVFEANDLVNLDKFHIYIKLLIDGISSPAFSAKTLPPVQKLTGNTEKIIDQSHKKYSTMRSVIEEQIANRSKEEERELKAEAEAFKQGGLEALLTKNNKNISIKDSKFEKAVERKAEPEKAAEPVKAAGENGYAERKENVVSYEKVEPTNGAPSGPVSALETEPDTEKESNSKPRVFKFQNIIEDRIYKEQTARGGVKWFIGEDIDLEKNKELGVEITDNAMKMMELAKKVGEEKKSSLRKQEGPKSERQSIDKVAPKQAENNLPEKPEESVMVREDYVPTKTVREPVEEEDKSAASSDLNPAETGESKIENSKSVEERKEQSFVKEDDQMKKADPVGGDTSKIKTGTNHAHLEEGQEIIL